jgi:hypothetical protein
MTAEILLVAAVVIVLATAFLVLSRRSGAATSEEAGFAAETEEGIVSDPVPIAATRPLATTAKAEVAVTTATAPVTPIGWVAPFEPRSGALDDRDRLKLINDLGMLGAAWCIPLLEQACREEPGPGNRTAAHAALARCRDAVTS